MRGLTTRVGGLGELLGSGGGGGVGGGRHVGCLVGSLVTWWRDISAEDGVGGRWDGVRGRWLTGNGWIVGLVD